LFPKSLKIWGHEYKVLRQKDPRIYDGKDNPQVLGYFSGNEQTICVKKALDKKPTQAAEILMHEVFHGIAYHTNVFEGMRDKEEHVVDTMATGLILILKDNPELVDYLKESLK
jgi:hypothetical protein